MLVREKSKYPRRPYKTMFATGGITGAIFTFLCFTAI